jgi:hypothetical protein
VAGKNNRARFAGSFDCGVKELIHDSGCSPSRRVAAVIAAPQW